jgi:hypothetical protein
MPSLTIPPATIPAGPSPVGPFSTGAGFNAADLVLDIGNLKAPCDMLMRIAFDGVTWQDLARQNPDGPPKNRDGTPKVPATMTWAINLGEFDSGDGTGPHKVLTTATTKIELLLDNTTAFATSGGSITPR